MQPSLPFDQADPNPQSSIPKFRSPIPNPESPIPNPESPIPNPQFVFTRHPKARRYIIRVADDGTVRVTLPRWGSKREARAFADRERAWIEKQVRRLEEERERGGPTGAEDEGCLTREAQLALRARAKRELPPRLIELAAQHGLTVSRISIRNQRWRWGSCNRGGHICLNWKLVTMPEPVRDYVLIHELMHLKRMDHSPKFWKLVAAACPGYQDARRWLRQQPRA